MNGLDALSKNLSDKQCKNLRWFYGEVEHFKLMKHKGLYQYKYMDSGEYFEEMSLPPKETVCNELNIKDIKNEDSTYAAQV